MEKHLRSKLEGRDFLLLQKLLTMDPLLRITADEAVEDQFFKVTTL